MSRRLVRSWSRFRDECYPDRCKHSVGIAPRCTSQRVPGPHVRIRMRYTGKKKKPPRTVPGFALFPGVYATHAEEGHARGSRVTQHQHALSALEFAADMSRLPSRLRAGVWHGGFRRPPTVCEVQSTGRPTGERRYGRSSAALSGSPMSPGCSPTTISSPSDRPPLTMLSPMSASDAA